MDSNDHHRQGLISSERWIPHTTLLAITSQTATAPFPFCSTTSTPFRYPNTSSKEDQLEEDDPFDGIPLKSPEIDNIATV